MIKMPAVRLYGCPTRNGRSCLLMELADLVFIIQSSQIEQFGVGPWYFISITPWVESGNRTQFSGGHAYANCANF
jgi:hypothetical protein